MKIRLCPICTAEHFRILQKFPEMTPSCDLVECSFCQLLYIQPCPPSEKVIAQYLENDYFQRGGNPNGYSNYLEDRELHVAFFRKQLAWLESQIPPGKLLDVGCAAGFLVEEANRRGWEASGVDLSPFAIHHARHVLKLEVFHGKLREMRVASNSFRVVIMNDVIEHFEDPLAEAQEVARILEPGGIWLLHTPNAKSPWRWGMGKKWMHLKPSEHLTYFTPDTIRKLFESSNLQPIMARSAAKATHLKYIVGVIGKKYPFAANQLHQIFGNMKFWKKPFEFRGGGMQAAARKPIREPGFLKEIERDGVSYTHSVLGGKNNGQFELILYGLRYTL